MSGFWQRQRQHEDGVAVASLLASGQLTPAGEQFVAGMARTLSGWEDEPVPPVARMIAQ